jgi:hypothetical protein
MMRLRRASVIATLSLLAWAVTAHAECAWILWQKHPDERYEVRDAFPLADRRVEWKIS